MKRQWIHALLVLVTTFGLSACAQFQREEVAAAPEEPAPDEGYEEWALMVKGVPIEQLVEEPGALRQAVIELVGTDNTDEIDKFISVVRSRSGNVEDVPANLTGIGAFPGLQLLEAYFASVNELPERRKVSGKIGDYFFNDADKSGHLSVNTKVEYFDTAASYASKTPDRVQRYHWHIEVLPETYEVRPHSGKRDDPFPGTLAFAEPMLTNIEQRGLDHKLWATGTGIDVRQVYEVFSDGSITLLADGHPYYSETAASCIDMLFRGYPPAIDLPAQPAYCLGRCAQPEVVNTR
jgi:hypothetical protein